MKSSKFAVIFLSISAAALFVACLSVNNVRGEVTIHDHEYMVVTAPMQQGGDALYVADARTGNMLILTYDPAKRSMEPRVNMSLANLFNK